MKTYNTDKLRMVKSEDYNYVFDKTNGFFARWGKTKQDDPQFAPMPEILDCEISTICKGVPDKNGIKTPCPFCYKSNTPNGVNMSFETFKTVLDKMPSIMQVAFGADSECTANPDIWKMMAYCREKMVVPNITVANISDETADNLAKYCGAVACSRYSNKNSCYDSVKRLTDRGMTQVNIHILVSDNSYDDVMETLNDRLTDKRLEKLHAIVMLNLKKCGRGTSYNTLSDEKFKTLVDFAFKNNITIGFDSCGQPNFLRAIKDYPNFKQMETVSEPCEANCFSSYCSVDAKYYPCSFCDEKKKNELDWTEGLDILTCADFIKDIWNHPKSLLFRTALLKNNRACPMYDV